MHRALPILLLAVLALSTTMAAATPPAARVLVYTRTEGWRHDSIPAAVAALQRLAAQEGAEVDHSEDPVDFTSANLARYRTVVFANTTGDVLDQAQQQAMQEFVRSGGSFIGLHAAADTEYGWPWYGQLVGAWFLSHPPGLQTVRVQLEPEPAGALDWRVTDELYNYRDNPRGRVRVIATVDERDYQGGTMGADHPIAWCHESLGGRAWYAGLGHSAETYADARFTSLLQRGLRYALHHANEC